MLCAAIPRYVGVLAMVSGLLGCGVPVPSPRAPTAPEVASYPRAEGSWGRYVSSRLRLSIPLPDGKAWRIDDHSQEALIAVHDASDSRVVVLTTHEDELVNRQKCEARARRLGWISDSALATIEDEVTIGPDAYDSRIWVALETSETHGPLTGHVFMFGGLLRQCMLVHVSSRVPSAKHEGILSERLAMARARIVRGITLAPTRTTDSGSVPRETPSTRPHR